MRTYALNLKKYGISHDRYEELRHFCLQYDVLSLNNKALIDEAADKAAGEYSRQLKLNICCKGIPYKYIDIPFSESQFKRMRRMFFVYLNEMKEK